MHPTLRAFPRIADYGLLSDCHTGALVAPDGSIEWLCVPRFDSPSVFGAILDRGAGRFRFGPRETVPVARRYEPGTNILETTWATPTGWLVVRDVLTIGPWRSRPDDPHTRPPPDLDAERVLVRVAECVQGEVEVDLSCHPRLDYGRAHTRVGAERGPAPRHHPGRRRAAEADPEQRSQPRDRDRAGRGASPAQRRRALLLRAHLGRRSRSAGLGRGRARPGRRDGRVLAPLARERNLPDHPWRIHLQRSALALKGLTYSPSGATVAALTTSLPESPGGERNWDYRYCWIRDATFTLWSLHVLGLDAEADDFARFIGDICHEHGNKLQIMYGLGGERDLTESTLDQLSGYGGAKPVRVGNGAFYQLQNDVYGALVDSLYIHTKADRSVPPQIWPIVADQVETAAAIWEQPDQGIWEARGEPKHYVSSKLMCWVAIDRGARLATRRGEDERADALARDRRPDPARTSSSAVSRTVASCASTTTPTRSTPRPCSRRCCASCHPITR